MRLSRYTKSSPGKTSSSAGQVKTTWHRNSLSTLTSSKVSHVRV